VLTVVTGGGGFVGQAVMREMHERQYPGSVRLLDRVAPQPPSDRFEGIACDLTDRDALRSGVAGAARVLHLAALPGAASEIDATASRAINLDATIDVIDLLSGTGARLVYASSIAVLGGALPASVGDDTPVNPSMTYGAHKAMCETALADAVRRRDLDAIALRLPGIVARPRSAGGFGSAFLSDIFHAVAAGTTLSIPTRKEARTWLLSARACARNLVHALLQSGGPSVVSMPAIHVGIGELVEEIARQSQCAVRVEYEPVPEIEKSFAAYPPLATPLAESLGLVHDGSLAGLVTAVLADIRST